MTTPTREQSMAWAREADMSQPQELMVNDFWMAEDKDIERFAALAYAAGAAAEALKWTEALADLQIINWVAPVEDPRKAINDLIEAQVQIALDPAVSSDAQALIDRGAASMRDCRTCMNRDEGINHCSTTAQCINASQYTPRIPVKMWRKE